MFVVSQKPKNKSKFIIRTDPSRIINPQNIILNTNSQIPKLNPSIIPPQQTQNIIIQKNQPLIKKIFPHLFVHHIIKINIK